MDDGGYLDQKTRMDAATVALSIVGAVVACAVALSALAPSQVTTAILFMLTAAPWLILFPRWARWHGWKFVFATMISIATLTTGVWRLYHPDTIAVVPQPHNSASSATAAPASTQRSSPSAGSQGIFTITKPENGKDSPTCVEVEGGGKLPEGKTLLLAIGISGTNYYSLLRVEYSGTGSWRTKATLGDPKDERIVGRVFSLQALVMDTDLVNYDLAIAKTGGPGWWAAPTLPPRAEVVASTTTTRNGLDNCG